MCSFAERELVVADGGLNMSPSSSVTIGEGKIKFGLEYRDLLSDQGVCIHVIGDVAGEDVELLRFDCFDHEPHYHYGPEARNERLMLDSTTEGDSLDWTLRNFSNRLPEMIERAGYDDLAEHVRADDLSDVVQEVSSAARKMAQSERRTVIHDRGNVIVEAGSVRFGIEYRHLANDEGVAIHVLGDVGDKELELLTFDCFKNAPHYHYGPRAKNQRIYLDQTASPDSLRWALDLLKGGKLGPMLHKAGYADHASRLNPTVLLESMAEVEKVSIEMDREELT
ncbi:uncharacterized protein METZ01_LOCUS4426 [marine metagenome]|uniref:DUF7700 domain-containing protein n=1 Tax=marine metagenome TaxID=408172 RepID=A0A381NAF0_9ZZZZ